jgi:phage gpG-like protein
MIDLQVELDKVPFAGVTENYGALVNTAFRLFAKDVVANAKEWITPGKSGLNNRTGALKASIKLASFTQFSPNSGATAVITAGNQKVPYGAIHEYGGVIRPKAGQYLTFQVNGRWVRVRQVTIPARPYLKPAYEEVTPKFNEYLQDAIDRYNK